MERVVLTVKAQDYESIDTTARWGVVNDTSLSKWWLDPAYSGWANIPMTNKLCDRGDTDSRGRNFIISNDLWDFVHELNFYDARAIANAESVGRQIVNRKWIDRWGVIRQPISGEIDPDNIPDPFANAEPVCYPANPLKIIGKTATHYRIAALNVNTNWRTLDRKEYTWIKKPYLFPKMCAQNRKGQIQNVMNGLDVWFVSLCHDDGAWIPRPLVTLAPNPSQYIIKGMRGVGYRVQGSHWIMGLENGSQVYVRHVTKSKGVRNFYDWEFDGLSVIPPTWFS